MNKIFLPSSIGLILAAIITSFVTWKIENIWIPITAIFLALSAIVFSFKLTINSLEKRLNMLEEKLIQQMKVKTAK